MNFEGTRYHGLDVVPSVIASNNRRFASETVTFSMMPERLVDVPAGDLLLMKDVLQHLPNSEIHRFAIEAFPKFKFSLLTNSYSKVNTPTNIDVTFGSFRSLDLSAPPYSFPGCYLLEFPTGVWERVRTFLYQAPRK
jgi:hypothetical protein